MDRVRRVGVITDAEDDQVSNVAKQIIDDLLFKLKQTEEEKDRLTSRAYDVISNKSQKRDRRRMEDESSDNGESRLPKRRD